jgi:broad specificity phosphatase PhoE
VSQETGRSIYLIKHAEPAVQPDVPAEQWTLSHRGIEEARGIAEAARAWNLQAVYSSFEPKAKATGLIIAEPANLQVRVIEGFEELRLGQWIANADDFNDLVRQILDAPAESAHGAETARSAAARFEAAMNVVLDADLPAAVVSHGRILAAYLSCVLRESDPFALWRSIPSAGVARLDATGSELKLRTPFVAAAALLGP